MDTIDITVQGVAVDYATARAVVQPLAEKAIGAAMLLAWFDGKNNAGHPEVQECTGKQPGWLAYAENHGGKLRVNVNHHEFVFVFATEPDNQGG